MTGSKQFGLFGEFDPAACREGVPNHLATIPDHGNHALDPRFGQGVENVIDDRLAENGIEHLRKVRFHSGSFSRG